MRRRDMMLGSVAMPATTLSAAPAQWGAVTADQIVADIRHAMADLGMPGTPPPWCTYPRTGPVYVDGVERGTITMDDVRVSYGGRASGKTDRMRRRMGVRSDVIPRVINPA